MLAKHIKTILKPNYYRDNLHTKVNMMLPLTNIIKTFYRNSD